ncbi:hypothetical protein HK104_008634 [Borealophlyctis nickersoniae]|nr:hypothetical protein HK104_008634 [Borealophlyctis nickersoniae]
MSMMQVIVSLWGGSKPITINFSPSDYASSLPCWADVKMRIAQKIKIPVTHQALLTIGGGHLHDDDHIVSRDEITTGMGPNGEVIVHALPVMVKLTLAVKGGGASRRREPKFKRGREDMEEEEQSSICSDFMNIDSDENSSQNKRARVVKKPRGWR